LIFKASVNAFSELINGLRLIPRWREWLMKLILTIWKRNNQLNTPLIIGLILTGYRLKAAPI
jgi:hypothetical protein